MPLLPSVAPVESYDAVTCLLLSALALLVVRALLPLGGHRPWDTAMFGLSPLLLVQAFTNWDLLAIAFATLGMWAWARRRPVLAGALLGLGMAAKLYPVLLLAALLVLCLRAGRLRQGLASAGAAAIAWAAVDVPVAVLAPSNWARFFTLSGERPANPETVWNMLIHASGGRLFDGHLAAGQTPHVLNTVIGVVLVATIGGLVWLALAAPLRPRLPQLGFLFVAAFLLLNKVWSPQYSLWLLPLAVLARPQWRSLLIWQATEAVVWLATLLYLLGPADKGTGITPFFLAVGLRDLVVLTLMGLVVRDVLRPDGDVVRTSWPGTDDPAGGVLDHAEDRVVLSRRAPA